MFRKLTAPTRLLLAIVTLALSFGSLAACSSAPSAPPPATYTTTLVEADVPSEFPEDVRDLLLGTWELALGNDNRYQVSKDGNLMLEGHYASTKDQIALTDEGGPAACLEPGQETGTYKWSVNGQTLTLTPMDDKCGGRSLVLTTHSLTKQK